MKKQRRSGKTTLPPKASFPPAPSDVPEPVPSAPAAGFLAWLRNRSPWQWFVLFVLVWLGLRIFWLSGDPGVPSIWEYGFNATDEGYYFGAAKDKYLRGAFCDFARMESFTYGYSPLTHWLALAAYRVFGLSDWAWRIPAVALYFLAWALSFRHVARRCGGVSAFVWCALFSSVPVVVAYERTACNDLVIGSLAVVAFCVASGRGVWRLFAAAAVAGAISLVKPSVWVLLPVVAAGVLSERKTRSAWLDLALFAAASFLSVLAWKGIALLSVLPETGIHGMTASEIIRRTTTHNPLPSLLDPGPFLRGFSSFPRDVCFKAFAAEAAFVSAIPLAMAARCVLKGRWNWRLLLYLSVPAYAAAVSVNNSICLHYYHPALSFLPVLFAETALDLDEDAPEPAMSRTSCALALSVPVVLSALTVSAVAAAASDPRSVIPFVSNISNLPRETVWKANAAYVLVPAIASVLAAARFRGWRPLLRCGWAWFLVAAVGASVAVSAFPLVQIAPRVGQTAAEWLVPMGLSLVASFAFLAFAFVLPAGPARSAAFRVFVPAVVVACFVLSPTWRRAAAELVAPPRRVQRDVAAEIARLVPENAVVIGERSAQVLMGRPVRTATTMPGCDPTGILEKLREREPDTPLFALADSQNAYNLQHYREHAGEYALQHLATFQMPSFGNGRPAPVYLLRIRPLGLPGKVPAPSSPGIRP